MSFVFFISTGIDNFFKGINFSNSNYLSAVQPYREMQSIFDNMTIYHNGYVDEEKLGGISKAKFKILLIMNATSVVTKNQPKKRLIKKFLLIKILLLTNKVSMIKM